MGHPSIRLDADVASLENLMIQAAGTKPESHGAVPVSGIQTVEASDARCDQPTSAPLSSQDQSSPHQSFNAALADIPLFKSSRWERLAAWTVPMFTKMFRVRRSPEASTVVSRLTLWERFLSHQPRRARRMTFAVAIRDRPVAEDTFGTTALMAFIRIMTEHETVWENQPLNVVVGEGCRTQTLDPRKSTGEMFSVAVQNAAGVYRTCRFNLTMAVGMSDDDLAGYVQKQSSAAEPSTEPVSVVIDRAAADPETFGGSFAEFPGAWLRLAPDKSTGGFVATADHLVLDGALMQSLLIAIAKASTENSTGTAALLSKSTEQDASCETFSTLRLNDVASLSVLLMHIVTTLEESGIEFETGRDTILLTTIPQTGPDVNQEIHPHRRRILPLIMSLQGVQDCGELRRRVQQLNTDGWRSIGAQVWNHIYSGNVPAWLVTYFERISRRVPFQQAARALSGGALVSFLPPVTMPGFWASSISHLSCRTIGTVIGSPTITVMQVRDNAVGRTAAFITISGSGRWNDARKLDAFRNALACRISGDAAMQSPTCSEPATSETDVA